MVLNRKIFKLFLILIIFLGYIEISFSVEPKEFIQLTVDRASAILNNNFSKEKKIKKLKVIANETVDIRGIGFYSLGKHRKNLSDNEKNEYVSLFKQYFLKSFASRLAEYTDPKIKVSSQEKLNDNYTIVSSTLIATEKRTEVKIDWRIYTKNPENPLIRDLIIEGVSLARTQKEEFNSIIQSNDGDINALFSSLRKFIKAK